ncbi:hypothetical protein QRD38_11320 [Leptospira weilii]|uniref:hypothetical protein n=1 Tax=Leptospira weilii TaxID=28184 RepID=UPI00256F4A37|nr:hypothetical protein [Leptospira weilii]MDL5246365.1 hypothetical protein [Leptospira weilii]
MAMLARRFIKLNRYDFYYSRVVGIANNLNGKHNFSEREENHVEGWVSWSYAVNKAIGNFSALLKRSEISSEDPHINASWRERFYYIVNLLRRDSTKINKKRLINRIADSLNKFSFSNEVLIQKPLPFSYTAFLESSKLNFYNREIKYDEKKRKPLKWSRSVKRNRDTMNYKIFINPPRHLSAWDHCFHRSEIGIKHLYEDSWQKAYRQCWNSIERISKYWDKRLNSIHEIPDL